MCRCMVQCCGDIIVGIFVIVNVICTLFGLCLLGVGIWLMVDPTAQATMSVTTGNSMNGTLFLAACILIIVAGSLCFLLGFLAWFGVCCRNSCMMAAYQVWVVIILLIEITATVLTIVYSNDISVALQKEMIAGIQNDYGQPSQPELTDSWDTLQVKLECCGAAGYTDYDKSFYESDTGHPVAWSCCTMTTTSSVSIDNVQDLNACSVDGNKPYLPGGSPWVNTMGCNDSIKAWMKSYSAILIGCACGLVGFQILGLIIVSVLRRRGFGDEEKY